MTRFTVATWRRDAGAKGRDGRTAAVVWARGEVGWTRGGSRDGERGDLETHLGSQGVEADEGPSSCPLGSGVGGAQKEKFRGMCGRGFDPSSVLEEAGMTQTEADRGFLLWHRNRSRGVGTILVDLFASGSLEAEGFLA